MGTSTGEHGGRRNIHANGFFVFFFAQHERLLRGGLAGLERR